MSENTVCDNNSNSYRGLLAEVWFTLMRSIGLGHNEISAVSSSSEELISLISESASGLNSNEVNIIRNLINMRDITAQDLMIPRADILAVSQNTNLSVMLQQMIDSDHSSIPVYRDSLDDVIGMAHIKDVLANINKGCDVSVGALVRDIMIVAPSSRALELLQEMRITQRYMALVVDEYGGIDGLIAVEDLIRKLLDDKNSTTQKQGSLEQSK
ncbi:CBS domain pair family protein [Candidatus Endolissoclinum faulkneri L2]|uniref:CBS domain pair family protein n=1 Tax=Candidatus Endolissoclinum faulkneri L2 TaxID=1193729 RepID=K7ZC45_9PROT|nr:CBS domain-containing protein [Candidatus Endolissoclinum faulkneri]AFX98286.1 CBS domain pair family protein [Candidatus Endolissoclinum faulkneri L2]